MTGDRLDFRRAAPEAYRALAALDRTIDLDPSLSELVELRASQLNGCAFCIDLHTRTALASGEDGRRLWSLPAWRETEFFTDRERAALALTEAVTRLSEHGVPDDVYAAAAENFDGDELGQLLFAISTINLWNRVSVSTRRQPSPNPDA